MNPRQRRGLLLTILSALGAVGVFVAVSSYVGGVRAQLGELRPALVLVADVPASAQVAESDVSVVRVPRRYLSSTTLFATRDLGGRVASTRLRRGSYLQEDMLAPPPSVRPGEREITVSFGVDNSVSGRVRPNDLVDVYATYKDDRTRAVATQPVVLFARVLRVRAREAAGTPVYAVTFALTRAETLRLSQAAATAASLRLALVPAQERVPSRAVVPAPVTGSAPTPGGTGR